MTDTTNNDEPTMPTREQIVAMSEAEVEQWMPYAPTSERSIALTWFRAGADAVLAVFSQPSPSAGLSVAEQTSVTRSIDEEFMQEGGTTRHWVQALNRAGYVIAAQPSPSTPSIDDAMVERAARVLFEDPAVDGDWTWDDLLREDGPERAKMWRDHARLILEAALAAHPSPISTEPVEDDGYLWRVALQRERDASVARIDSDSFRLGYEAAHRPSDASITEPVRIERGMFSGSCRDCPWMFDTTDELRYAERVGEHELRGHMVDDISAPSLTEPARDVTSPPALPEDGR